MNRYQENMFFHSNGELVQADDPFYDSADEMDVEWQIQNSSEVAFLLNIAMSIP